MSLTLKIEKSKFWRARLRESLQCGTPYFSRAQAFPDIFNRSNFGYSALGGLKVDSRRRKRKKKKKVRKKKNKKKNSIQIGVYEHNQKKGG